MWRTISSEVLFSNSWLKLHRDQVIDPKGKSGQYTFFEANDFVVIVAIKKTKFLIVEQYRYPVDRVTLEFPAGGIEKNEEPLIAAQRELKEETGYTAKEWIYLGEFFELAGLSKQKGHLFIAKDLNDSGLHQMKEEGITRKRFLSNTEIESFIKTNEIIDALTPACYTRASLYLDAAA